MEECARDVWAGNRRPPLDGVSTPCRHWGTTDGGGRSRCGGGEPPDREADPAMSRLFAAALTVALAAALAVGAALGVVALLEATPDQPNTPLITHERAGGSFGP
ncbi:hypothetical protein GCM10019016_040400 [Streptomyces prasinosporus]|uniref:DUF2613 family protein n=2 Tax=Streptomyces prasinosporus TaxID=68256 RepID=A0ABP6TQX2_9ACTN